MNAPTRRTNITAHHETLALTIHAQLRCVDRQVPIPVRDALVTNAAEFVGHQLGLTRIRYRITLYRDKYWIAPRSDDSLITIYSIPTSEAPSWAFKHLLNPTQTLQRLLTLHRIENDELSADEQKPDWSLNS